MTMKANMQPKVYLKRLRYQQADACWSLCVRKSFALTHDRVYCGMQNFDIMLAPYPELKVMSI